MTVLRSCRLWCLVLALASLPLHAQDQDHDQDKERDPDGKRAPAHAIADGTTFLIRLAEKLDVSQIQPGKRFKAKLEEDMRAPDESVILHGSRIRGHVSAVGNGFHPRLLLSFDEIETPHGWTPLIATITAIPGEHGLTTGDEGQIEREGQSGSPHHDADSDGIAAKAGVAAGVLRAVFSDHRLQLQKGTILEVRLDRPLQIPQR
jgi:hypothetical protein